MGVWPAGLHGDRRLTSVRRCGRCGRGYDCHGRSASGADTGVAIVASGGANGEPVGRAPVLALIEVALHVPSPTEGLAARRAPVGAAVNVSVVLERTRMFEDLAALVASVAAHTVRSNRKGLGHRVWKITQVVAVVHHMAAHVFVMS